jgi:colanic acid/amylovoran biosynthesis glycosyltransferase
MFPCWSETFILNELIDHSRHNLNVSVLSLKRSTEKMVQNEALPFLARTVYPLAPLNPFLWWLHLILLFTSPRKYLTTLSLFFRCNFTNQTVRLKSLMVFFLSPAFIRATRKESIEHLHAHFATYPALLAFIINRFNNVSFSVTAHAHDIYVNMDILRLVVNDVSTLFTISDFNKCLILQNIGDMHGQKVQVLHCGVDVSKFPFQSQKRKVTRKDALRLLSIGRLSGIKGFQFLLSGLKYLQDEGVNFHCEIIGDGPLKNSLLTQTSQLGIDSRVSFLGSKTSDVIPRYLKNTDVFVLACSYDSLEGHDGIPVVFMEAMALGVPVIGTRLSGIPELIRNEETGLCVEVNDPLSIKNAIFSLLDNPDKASEMRKAARKLIEEDYNIQKISQELRDYFTVQIRENQNS